MNYSGNNSLQSSLQSSAFSIISSAKKLEDKIADDIHKLKNVEISFDMFFKYIFGDCCGCLDKECNIVELRETKLNNILRYSKDETENKDDTELSLHNLDIVTKLTCNKIRVDIGNVIKHLYNNLDNISGSKIALVIKFIELFQKNGLIRYKQNMYFLLNTNMRFKWNNIKRLTIRDIKEYIKEYTKELDNIRLKYLGKDEDISEAEVLLMIKSLFWYFRKVVVDSIISDLINFDNLDIKAMSVGSTRMTSDYDVTLDGKYKDNARLIKKYNRFIEILFMDDSEDVFDTNVYGVSFIKDISRDVVITPLIDIVEEQKIDASNKVVIDAFDKEHLRCGKFNYISSDDKNFVISQHIWAFIKLLLRLNKVQQQDEELFGLFLDDLSKKFSENIYYNTAIGFMNKYESDVDYYQKTVGDAKRFLGKDIKGEDNKYLVSNFISYVNFNGSETYLTNGAFLDVVVNGQMCKRRKEDMLKLDINSYLDSFIENLSDLITHYHKVKYLDRARDAFKNIEIESGFDVYMLSEYINKKFDMISQLQKNCSRDILQCQSFIIIQNILDCITVVCNRYKNWSNISSEELKIGVNKFNDLDFKNFRVPIESKIREIIE